MAKKSSAPRTGGAFRVPGEKKKPDTQSGTGNPVGDFFASRSVRETIESIAIAFVLAFLFRTFEAEAFVIPTGSMAHTLMGRHKDLACPECGYEHEIGHSLDQRTNVPRPFHGTTCPICRHPTNIPGDSSAYPSYTGDRILVNKFIYDITEPRRWDIAVFKEPTDAKTNFIKRIVGLPGETLRIYQGDLWTRPLDDPSAPFQIARRPPDKLLAMMQQFYDTHYIPSELSEAGWPNRWQPQTGAWKPDEQQRALPSGQTVESRSFAIDPQDDASTHWLRYHHLPPSPQQWLAIKRGQTVVPPAEQLVTDFYSYNAEFSRRAYEYIEADARGMHWVGDLILECDVEVTSDNGDVLLDIVEGGRHYRCKIDLATGRAELAVFDLAGTQYSFPEAVDNDDQRKAVFADTLVAGPGKYELRFAQVDNGLMLWVNGEVIRFDGPRTTEGYTPITPPPEVIPDWNDDDEGDLAPVGIGSRGANLRVERLRLYRDMYYIAVKNTIKGNHSPQFEYSTYDLSSFVLPALFDPRGYREQPSPIVQNSGMTFEEVFRSRQHVDFALDQNQFFACGDNSPQSSDARVWGKPNYVDRRFLIGKAMFIYFPHPVKALGFPYLPNFKDMGFVR